MLTLFLCTLIGILFISLILISYFNNHANAGVVKNVKVRPPGPYRFPIVGNLVQIAMINLKEPYLAFRDLSEKYGDVMSIQLGSVYAVMFSSLSVMEEYLSKPEFSDRYVNAYVMERSFHKQMGIIFAKYPEPCRVLRRFSLRTLREFGFGQRNRMLSVIQNELSEIVHELKQNKTENKWIHNFDGYFALSFLNVLWSMLAGSRYEHSDPKLQRLIKTVRSMLSAANMSTNILMAYPQLKDWFPGWTGMTALRKWNDEMIAFSSEFIAERRKLGIYKTSPDNVIDEFLREIDAHEGEDTVYTDEQLIVLMKDFFIAGSDTTNNTLSYCILHLILNPHVQKRLQEEVDKNVPRGTFPTAEHEFDLHYVRATIAEAHRMTSVFPLMVPRTTTTNIQCGNYFIPKGTLLMANIYGIHFNKNHWKDPETFRPERFLDATGKFRNDDWLRPFGFGKRICPGQQLASISLTHYLAVLMQNFTFHPVPNEPIPSLQPIVGVTNGPQPFRALIEARSLNEA